MSALPAEVHLGGKDSLQTAQMSRDTRLFQMTRAGYLGRLAPGLTSLFNASDLTSLAICALDCQLPPSRCRAGVAMHDSPDATPPKRGIQASFPFSLMRSS